VFSHVTLERDVACLDVTPLEEGSSKAEIVAVGLRTEMSVRILRLPHLHEVHQQILDETGETWRNTPIELQLVSGSSCWMCLQLASNGLPALVQMGLNNPSF
jgi:hypothetical protein